MLVAQWKSCWISMHCLLYIYMIFFRRNSARIQADTAKLTGPQTFADKRWVLVGMVKLLCIIMFNIGKIRPKSLLGPVKAQKFSWGLIQPVQMGLLFDRPLFFMVSVLGPADGGYFEDCLMWKSQNQCMRKTSDTSKHFRWLTQMSDGFHKFI